MTAPASGPTARFPPQNSVCQKLHQTTQITAQKMSISGPKSIPISAGVQMKKCRCVSLLQSGSCSKAEGKKWLLSESIIFPINTVKEGFSRKIYSVFWVRDRAFTFHLEGGKKKVSPLVLLCDVKEILRSAKGTVWKMQRHLVVQTFFKAASLATISQTVWFAVDWITVGGAAWRST